MSKAELGHLESDLLSAQLDIARLRAALAEFSAAERCESNAH
jgi:hypothetical protein